MDNHLDALEKLTDYQKLIDCLGRELISLHEICGALKEVIEQTGAYQNTYGELKNFFYIFIRLSYSEIYHGISRLIDETKGVVSIIKLLRMREEDKPAARAELAAIEKEFANRIQKNETAQKIKAFRNKKLGHTNQQLLLNSLLDSKFCEENKLDINDIEALLQLLGSALQRASERAGFHIITASNTSVRIEIQNLFEWLSSIPL